MSRQIWTIAAGKTASATLILTMALGAGQAAAQAGYTAYPVPQQAAPIPAQSVYLGGQQAQQPAQAAQSDVVAVSEPYTLEQPAQQAEPAPAYAQQGYAMPVAHHQGYGVPAYPAPYGYMPVPPQVPHAPHAPVEFDYGVSDASQTVYMGDSHALGYGVPQPYNVGQDTVYYEAPASYPTYPAYPAAPAPQPQYTAPQQPAPQAAYTAPAAPQQPAAPAQQAPAAAASSHYVQLGAFLNSANAEKLLREMNARGENVFVDPTTVNGKTFHRVRLGPIAGRDDAWAALNRVRGMGYSDARVIRN